MNDNNKLYILPTFTRVGSTWVSEIIRHLIHQPHKARGFLLGHELGTPLTDEEINRVVNRSPGVWKTHNFTPWDGKALTEIKNVEVVNVVRNFEDTMVSLLRYWQLRQEQGFNNEEEVDVFLDNWGHAEETIYMNAVWIHHRDFMAEKFRQWEEFSRPVKGVVTVDYDMFNRWSNGYGVKLIANLLGLKIPHGVIEKTSREAMLQTFPKGHVRRPDIKRGSELFNDRTKQIIKEISQ